MVKKLKLKCQEQELLALKVASRFWPESRPRVRLRLGALGMAKNLKESSYK